MDFKTAISLLVILAQLLILTALIFRKIKIHNSVLLLMCLIVAIVGMSGSLYFDEGLGLEPCELCWFQRILYYPLVLMFGIAFFKEDYNIRKYTIPMCIIGALISIYHYSIQMMNVQTSCGVVSGVSCSNIDFVMFGYITIPLMALTGFLFMLVYALRIKK